jgi:hypothetical protein
MLDHDARYLRPESEDEMNKRIDSLSASPDRCRNNTSITSSPCQKPMSYIQQEVSPSQYLLVESLLHYHGPTPICYQNSLILQSQFASSRCSPNADSVDVPSSSNVSRPSPVTDTPARDDEIASNAATMLPDGIQEIQRRVSGCSTHYAEQV